CRDPSRLVHCGHASPAFRGAASPSTIGTDVRAFRNPRSIWRIRTANTQLTRGQRRDKPSATYGVPCKDVNGSLIGNGIPAGPRRSGDGMLSIDSRIKDLDFSRTDEAESG